MRIVRLHLSNFRRYRTLDLELPDGVTALVGPNGSGKSTILEAILFGLFGTRALRTVKDQVRHHQAAASDAVEVVLELQAGPHAVRIERSLRTRSQTPDATLVVDEVVLVQRGAGSMDAATREMERILGLDLEGFRATVVAQQKDLGRLGEMRPTQRKQQILQMMGIERLDAAIQAARGQRRSLSDRLEGMRSLLADRDALRTRLASATQARTDARRALEDTTKAHEAARARCAAIDQHLATLRARHEAHRAAERRLAEAQARLETARLKEAHAAKAKEAASAAAMEAQRLEGAPERAAAAEKALQEARAAHDTKRQHQEATARLAALEKRLESARRDLPPELPADPSDQIVQGRAQKAALEVQVKAVHERRHRLSALGREATCPTCEQPLHDHMAATLARIDKEVQELEQALAAAEQTVVGHEALHVQWTQARARRAEIDRLQHMVDEARQGIPVLPESVPDVAAAEAAWLGARDEAHTWRTAAAKARELPAAQRLHEDAAAAVEAAGRECAASKEAFDHAPPVKDLASTEQAARAALAAERDVAARHAAAERAQALADQEVASASEALQQDARHRATVQDAETELRHWSALAGPRGGLLDAFRDHLTNRIGPALAQEAGRLLALFTDGRYDELVLDEDYEIYVTDGGIRYRLDRFSGGESDLVHLALRLAVGRLLAERSRAEIRFLALDEVFGSLDSDRRGLLLAALERLGGLYGQVLVVTHLGELRDALDHTLECVDDGDGGRLVMHNG